MRLNGPLKAETGVRFPVGAPPSHAGGQGRSAQSRVPAADHLPPVDWIAQAFQGLICSLFVLDTFDQMAYGFRYNGLLRPGRRAARVFRPAPRMPGLPWLYS